MSGPEWDSLNYFDPLRKILGHDPSVKPSLAFAGIGESSVPVNKPGGWSQFGSWPSISGGAVLLFSTRTMVSDGLGECQAQTCTNVFRTAQDSASRAHLNAKNPMPPRSNRARWQRPVEWPLLIAGWNAHRLHVAKRTGVAGNGYKT